MILRSEEAPQLRFGKRAEGRASSGAEVNFVTKAVPYAEDSGSTRKRLSGEYVRHLDLSDR